MEKTPPTPAPLTDDQAKNLLAPHEIVRDPVHRDIIITALERKIIDTSAFQRLRDIKQLGPTHLVYPGAVHTRFMHSIGTLHCAEELVHVVNHSFCIYSQPFLMQIDPYPHLLIRLCSLLHDVAHMPFGHTLEDEGNLAPPEWDDKKRADHWLGEGKDIPQAISSFLVESEVPPEASNQVVRDVRNYLLNKKRLMEFDHPFIFDIVGNTLCADLLDYLTRDMYFSGLRERSGDRVVKYIAVVKLIPKDPTQRNEFIIGEGKGRVVLLAYRFEREHLAAGRNIKPVLKSEVLSEAIDLLRLRFLLAEKVFFHRTKLSASSMLISAMGSSSIAPENIYASSDGEFIKFLTEDENPRTKYLAEAYKARRLYRAVYILNYREERDTDQNSIDFWRSYRNKWRDPAWRKEQEEYLETFADLPTGSITIYCPDRLMNLKEFEMLVQSQPDSDIKELGNILDDIRKREMDAINLRYVQLWKLQVFVDPKALDVTQVSNPLVQNLSALCAELIDFPNDIKELQGKGSHLQEQIADRVIREYEKEHKLIVPNSHNVYKELIGASQRSAPPDLYESMKKDLNAIMQPIQKQLEFEPE